MWLKRHSLSNTSHEPSRPPRPASLESAPTRLTASLRLHALAAAAGPNSICKSRNRSARPHGSTLQASSNRTAMRSRRGGWPDQGRHHHDEQKYISPAAPRGHNAARSVPPPPPSPIILQREKPSPRPPASVRYSAMANHHSLAKRSNVLCARAPQTLCRSLSPLICTAVARLRSHARVMMLQWYIARPSAVANHLDSRDSRAS